MRAYMIILPCPLFYDPSRFLNRIKQPPVKASIPENIVEAFIKTILPWAAGVNIVNADTGTLQPTLYFLGNKLRAIITFNKSGFPPKYKQY